MDELVFDIELMITLIEARPVLWDKFQAIYKDRNATKKAWEEVCIDLKEDFNDLSDKAKNTFVKEMEKYGFLKNDPSFATRAIHEGNDPEQWNSLAVVPPISLATTFKQHEPSKYKLYEYGRSGNPTRDVLETCFASLEEAKYSLAFASGLAATCSVIHMLKAGDHVIAMDDLYGGTNRYFRKVATKFNVEVEFVDATDLSAIKKALRPNTKLVWIETPTNPTLKLVDIAGVALCIKDVEDCFLAVDSTFMTPYLQRPLTLGADLVVHSCTKYINGHSDVIMGIVAVNNEELHTRLRFLQNAIGGVPSPFDCYLVNRSLKTLALRMQQHMANGIEVAEFLEKHSCVEKVIHPCLPSHPQHELAKTQCYGHSGMLSFIIKGNNLETSKKFFKNLKFFTLAESLGGYESLAELPSVMTHASISQEERDKLGITDGLIRISCGLEDAKDLIEDLDKALKASAS